MTASDAVLGAPVERREGREKVTGAARYAAEFDAPGRAQAWPVPATGARGPGPRGDPPTPPPPPRGA
ncbi:hypothetical protein, partial [Streptomyces olivaceus]|uniref:hypothetical protein n=1 Tax=Streptomyces olivaceus TaxID=47716 RepID=UPI00366304E1